MLFRPTSLALLAALLLCPPAYAHVEVAAEGTLLAVKIAEDIASGDYERLLKGLRANPGTFTRKVALLDNLGGHAAEAMRMGRLLRETGFEVLVPSDGVCQGSCIYLLAAGTRRTIKGAVGLHRPYFAHGDSVHGNAGDRANPAAYFKAMGVDTRLAADMQATEPRRMRLLSAKDLAGYRLN
jgi:hypothetical protein